MVQAGLACDEAFLIALKRVGADDAPTRQFARDYAAQLWGDRTGPRAGALEARAGRAREALVAFGLALGAAAAVKVPALFGLELDAEQGFYARNLSLFVLPFLAGYFAWKRRLARRTVASLALAFAAAAAFANAYPFARGGSTEALTALHLPIALWLLVGIAYTGGRWSATAARMDFIRFTGELLIRFALLGLGGFVLIGLMALIFQTIGVDIEPVLEEWLLCCAAGAVLVAAWLVEAKPAALEGMAPVLARIFTPMFAAVLLLFLATLILTGRVIDIEREVLIAFDLLLVVVLGLLLYSTSARNPDAPPNIFDVATGVLLVSALLADALALSAIAARIGAFGFTPNRVAALGENVILLANLAWSAVLVARLLARRGAFGSLERLQTGYLDVYAAWAAIVAIVFPPLFGFI